MSRLNITSLFFIIAIFYPWHGEVWKHKKVVSCGDGEVWKHDDGNSINVLTLLDRPKCVPRRQVHCITITTIFVISRVAKKLTRKCSQVLGFLIDMHSHRLLEICELSWHQKNFGQLFLLAN